MTKAKKVFCSSCHKVINNFCW